METIISYIENVFRNYPDSEKVRKAKEDLLNCMEDKYHELKAEGKSENEAIGIVISEFGSMDEIAWELGFEKETADQADGQESGQQKRFTLEEARSYIKTQESFGVKIGIGVMFCILSPVAAGIFSALTEAGDTAEGTGELLGALILFGMVAAGVGILITSGIGNGKYDDLKECKITLHPADLRVLKEEFEAFNRTFGIKIAGGVALCILSVIPAILAESLFRGAELDFFSEMSGVSLFVFVSIGVFLFISAGTTYGAYETVLEKDGRPKFSSEKKKKKDRKISMIASIYWPVVTVIYLIWSFATFQWGISWLIWPIAGILFGGISSAISAAYQE